MTILRSDVSTYRSILGAVSTLAHHYGECPAGNSLGNFSIQLPAYPVSARTERQDILFSKHRLAGASLLGTCTRHLQPE